MILTNNDALLIKLCDIFHNSHIAQDIKQVKQYLYIIQSLDETKLLTNHKSLIKKLKKFLKKNGVKIMKLKTERKYPLIISFFYIIVILFLQDFLFNWWVALFCNLCVFGLIILERHNIEKSLSKVLRNIKKSSYNEVLENYLDAPLQSSLCGIFFCLLPTTYFATIIFSWLTVLSVLNFYRVQTIYHFIKK